MNQKTVNGHGFFRKSKAYGLVCGIALGLAFLGGQVQADEVTTATESQPTPEQVATQTLEEPSSKELNTALKNAEAAGVEVKKEPTQPVENQETAQADYAKQAAALETATEKQEELNAENAKITAGNEALVNAQTSAQKAAESTNQAVSEAQKDYHATVTEKVIDYDDGTSVAGYKNGQAQVEEIAKNNEQATTDYLSKKAEVDAHNAEVKAREDALKQNNLAKDEANLLYVTGEFDKSKTGLDYYKNIKVVTLDPTAKAVKQLGWQSNTVLTDSKGVTVAAHDTASDPAIHGTSSDFLYKVTDATVGDTFTLKNIGTTTDGTNINALVTVTKASSLTDKTASWFLIGKTKDNGIAVDYWNYDSLGLDFQFVDNQSKAIKLVLASVVGDVDNGQTSNVAFEGNTLNYMNPEDSQLVANANGSLTGPNVSVDGYQNAPVATYLMVGSSTSANYTHTSDPNIIDMDGNIVNYIEFDLFGTSSMVELEEFKYLPAPVLNLTSVTLPTAPVETPLKKNVKASYHLNEYKLPLAIVKDVVKDGVSINNGTLKIGEHATYTLEGAKVLANGKDKLVKYDVEDILDIEHDQYLGYRIYAFTPIKLTDGTILQSMADLKDFAKQTYDEVTGRFYVSLNSDFLAKIAKDSDFQAKVEIDFERIKAGDVFNTFNNHLAFEDKEGKVTEVPVPSNEVVTHTPEAPKESTPTPLAPETPKSALPSTGTESSALGLIGVAMLGILTLFGLKRKEAE